MDCHPHGLRAPNRVALGGAVGLVLALVASACGGSTQGAASTPDQHAGPPLPASGASALPASAAGTARGLQLDSNPGRDPVQPASEVTPALRFALQRYARRIGVTVGINQYQPPIPPLSAAVSDAEHTATLLRDMGFDRVFSISDREATRAAILELLQHRVALEAGPDDLVVVFFAGHGVSVGDRGFVLPQDATRETTLTGVSLQELKETALRMKAKHVLYLMDACFSGSMFRRAQAGEDPNALAYWEQMGGKRVVQIITAGGPNETASESGGWGTFTRAIHRGVEGPADANRDLVITAEELARFTSTEVQANTQGRQRPLWGTIEGDGAVLLWDARRVPVEARRERVTRELLPGMEQALTQIHARIERKEWSAAERAVRDLALQHPNPELNLLLAEVYAGQDARGNADLVETELKRVEGATLTPAQQRRMLMVRELLERSKRGTY